jgi:hypothetical protein
MDDGELISYLALQPGTPVLTSSGSKLGEVNHVLQDSELDLFDGITVRTGLHGLKFIDRDQISEIRATKVTCSISDEEAAALPKPHGSLVLHADPGDDEGKTLSARYGRMFGHEHWKELE